MSYAQLLLSMIDAIMNGGSLPAHHTSWYRVSMTACAVVTCSPCVAWSFVWRVVASPLKCIFKGPFETCRENGCTTVSDACVVACCTDIHKPQTIAPLHAVMKELDAGQRRNVVACLQRLHDILADGGIREGTSWSSTSWDPWPDCWAQRRSPAGPEDVGDVLTVFVLD